ASPLHNTRLMHSSRMIALCTWSIVLNSGFVQSQSQSFDTLQKLADDFWTWRAKYAPFTGDDVNRMERPGGLRDWSRASIEKRRSNLAEFETRWKKTDIGGWSIAQQVD